MVFTHFIDHEATSRTDGKKTPLDAACIAAYDVQIVHLLLILSLHAVIPSFFEYFTFWSWIYHVT